MELLNNALVISPIILIGSVVLIIIALSMKKNNKKSDLFFKIGFISASIYVFIILNIIGPYAFLSAFIKDNISFVILVITVVVVWLIVSIVIYFKNRLTILMNNEKEIYIRDVNVEYSPAVLAYLINNKIETKKDLSATLLNLCANNVLKLQKLDNGKVNIIDLKNEKQIEKLTIDEKYAYEMLTTKVTRQKIIIWKDLVKEEYEKYNFSKESKLNLAVYIGMLYILLILAAGVRYFINPTSTITNNLVHIIPIVFLSIWVSFELLVIKAIITASSKSEFVDNYTKRGAIEYNRWRKFERFIEHFTLIKEKDYENIVLLGKYLSYSIALGINKKCDKELYKKIDTKYSFNFDSLKEIFK